MSERPQILAFAPMHDSGGRHPHDATGAFQPEARAFVNHWRDHYPITHYAKVDNRGSALAMRLALTGPITSAAGDAVAVALFCHGWRTGVQLGFTLANAHTLAEALAAALRPDGVVALYACDTARDDDAERDDDLESGPGGNGGFADTLRDALAAARPDWRGWIDGHTIAAHTTKNPHVRRFEAAGGSSYLVAREGALWQRWRHALQSTDLRLRFPLMTRADVEAELGR